MSCSDIFGHPLRKPFRVAFNRVEILELHKDWCANLKVLARVPTKCANIAMLIPGCTLDSIGRGCGAWPIQGLGCDKGSTAAKLGEVHSLPLGMGSVYKSVDGSLYPVKIIWLLYITLHFSLSNITLHPTLHKGYIPMRDAIVSDRMICPAITVGRPGIVMSHSCLDCTLVPSGKFIVRGDKEICLLSTLVPSIMKMDVVPVSVMA